MGKVIRAVVKISIHADFRSLNTYSGFETAGIIPSSIFSSLASLSVISQIMILPSAPHVAYESQYAGCHDERNHLPGESPRDAM